MSEYYYLDAESCQLLQRWHHWLDNNRGDRARLRRAERPEDVLLTEAFFNFLKQMPNSWQEQKPIFSSAAVAGLLSHVKADHQVVSKGYQPKDEKKSKKMASFSEQLATSIKGDRGAMSELRFQQLQKSRTTDEFYRRMVRAIRLLDGRVNILSLANDIIQWHKEHDREFDRKPANRLAVRWATDYFSVLPNN
ncbi:type I-E CRISPR-associated protein Cse2/CasB [Desulfosudis oleivorans]|uniref:CRISPR-associated protein, Cse2 family n=1 Tax=Desulfosudis oleivorans (strain DSM 6200 / JCM 39069 / Hxd3) TaxID=96561 RepID=A8ZZ15_DESOH|nr:type I-E CRISPR-associated protein Cse2/CasB [Desulfosudis oleivorans]ABW68788.1 CRISPR-associated protein, Cse2 family [Desulfosudis oleivorans Hxd3]